jgi:acetate kinase
MKKILVINTGSSSVKADIYAIDGATLAFSGKAQAEKLRKPDSTISIQDGQGISLTNKTIPNLNVESALREIITSFEMHGLLMRADLAAIGHRVVHGGSKFRKPAIIDEAVMAGIQDAVVYAPLHNPANLEGIRFCQTIFQVPQVAVFDTAFHQSMPEQVYTYALPHHLTTKHGIRRYGFHGTSHEYVSRKCAATMGIEYHQFNAISLHLGNGASAAVIRDGKSHDTSMGFTPLEGLIMGTRSGDLDPAVVTFLQQAENLDAPAIEKMLNKESGLRGIAGTADMRDLQKQADSGNTQAKLAVQMFCLRVKKYICAYLAYGHPHAIIFTGGIGENAASIRAEICSGLEHLGIHVDKPHNEAPDQHGGNIGESQSTIALYVIPTDEEFMIAHAALASLN